MIELSKDHGEIKIVARDELDAYQSDGWRMIGLTQEDVIESGSREVQCNGGNNGNSCTHGNYNGACGITHYLSEQIKVSKPLAVIARSEDDVLSEIAELKSELSRVKVERDEAQSMLTQAGGKITSLTGTLQEHHDKIEALKHDKEELEECNTRVNAERGIVISENAKLRTHIHVEAMGKITRASEAALTGDPMHPLAFVALLDSLDRITAEPHEYVALIAELIDRRVIEEMTDENGCKAIIVKHHDKFRSSLRVLDSQKRLGINIADDIEHEIAF